MMSSSPSSQGFVEETATRSALQALKTITDRGGFSIEYEKEKVGEQEFRARIVLKDLAGAPTVLAWTEACLGLKKARQAAAELALTMLPQQLSATSSGAS